MKKQMGTIARAQANLQARLLRTQKIGPQVLTRNGRPTVVLVSLSRWKQLMRRV
jgi:prevent-host-death family protein